VNFLWGAFNLLAGLYLFSRHAVTVDFEPGFLALVLAPWLSASIFRFVSEGFGGTDPKADDAIAVETHRVAYEGTALGKG